MRIDFTRPLFDFSGEVLRDGDKPLVLGVVTVNALMGIYPDEQNLDGREKVRRYRLATSIYSANGPPSCRGHRDVQAADRQWFLNAGRWAGNTDARNRRQRLSPQKLGALS